MDYPKEYVFLQFVVVHRGFAWMREECVNGFEMRMKKILNLWGEF
jgi:hypothetical protein